MNDRDILSMAVTPEMTGLRRLTQHGLLRSSVLRFPEKTALVDVAHGYRQETYGELWERTNRLANAFSGLGVRKGDRVAYWMEDCLEHVEIWYAASKTGAVWTAVNALYTGGEAEYVINHSDAVVLIVSPLMVERLLEIKSKLTGIRHFITLGDKAAEGMISYESLLSEAPDREPDVEVRDTDWDSLTYTSGTTGQPSGSIRTHASGLGWEFNMSQMVGLTHEDKVWAWYPNFHWGGCVSTRPVLAAGGTRWIPGRPDPKAFLEVVQKEKINKVVAIPSIATMVCSFPEIDRYDTSSVMLWGSSGSAWLMPVREDVHRKFASAGLRELYSSTEAFFAWAGHHEVLNCERTSGFPAPGNEVRILDFDGNDLPPGKWGLIAIRGISVHDGYYKNPEKTAESMVGGWFTAHDIGFKDECGRVYVSDRAKDIINTGGETVYPAEVENVILRHPKVAWCAVVSSPDPVYTERVTAVIVLKPGLEGSEELAEEIREFCRDKLAPFKLPRKVDFARELPFVGSGKVNKKLIRAAYWKDKKFKV